jgi:cell division protein FtsZ
VGIVTLPFRFEGKKRMAQGVEGLTELKREVDTLIVIPNERLLAVAPNVPLSESFRVADNVLYQATKGISDLITVPGLVNLDFADVRSIMAGMGHAIMGTGYAAGEGRAPEAARAAISSPLLEDVDIRGAQGVLVNITGSETMTLHEVSEVTGLVQEAVGDEANIIFGAVIDPEAGEELRVTVIATGFPDAQGRPAESPVQRVQSAPPPLQKVESSPAASPSQPKPSPVRLGEEAQLPPRSPAPLHRAQRAEPSSGAEKTREQAMRAQAGTNADVGSPPDSRPRRSFGSLLDGLRSVPATEGDEPTDAASDEVGGADPSEARLGWTTREQPRFRAPQARDEEPVFGSDPASSSPPSRASHREDLDKPAFLRRLRD